MFLTMAQLYVVVAFYTTIFFSLLLFSYNKTLIFIALRKACASLSKLQTPDRESSKQGKRQVGIVSERNIES